MKLNAILEKRPGIYKITCIFNNKSYIGNARNVDIKMNVKELKLFCKNNNLSYSNIYRVSVGKRKYYKGYRTYLKPIESVS